MRWLIALLLLAGPAQAAMHPTPGPGTVAPKSEPCAYSQDFSGSADWDLDPAGNGFSWTISGGTLNGSGGSGDNGWAIYYKDLGSDSIWAYVQLKDMTSGNDMGVVVRCDDADWSTGDQCYYIGISSTGSVWICSIDFGYTFGCFVEGTPDIGSPSADDYLAVMVEGTGSSVVFDLWLETSEPDACDTNDGTGNCGWGPPDITDTTDPTSNNGSNVDGGQYAGAAGYDDSGTNNVQLDNWAAGNIGGTACP